jgi:DNA (cytosine-5)-methyltransferase 1
MKDYLEDEVDEKYYIDNEKADQLIKDLINKDTLMLDISQYKREGHPREYNDIAPTLTARDWKDPRLIQVGMLNIKGDEQVRRVYSEDGISPTLNTMQGGNRQPKVLVEGNKIVEPIVIGGMQKNQSVKTDGVCTTLTSSMGTGGGYTPMIVASRGRNPQNPSDRTPGADTEQRLEPNSEGICNTLTSVQKDNLVLEPKIIDPQGRTNKQCTPTKHCPTLRAEAHGNLPQVILPNKQYRIRKLTPKECWRLMGISNVDFHKAEQVNSNTQLYKQAGNAIVVSVLEAIFCLMNIQSCPTWEQHAKEHYL